MKLKRWISTGMALALAGSMLWAAPGYAQQGRGGDPQGPCYQGTPDNRPGRGPGAQYGPNYQDNQNCPPSGVNNPRTRRGLRGQRGGGRSQQPNTPVTPPAANQ